MSKPLKLVFGICLVLPYLWVLALHIYALLLPDGEYKGHVLGYLVILVLPVLMYIGGLYGDFFPLKRPVLSGVSLIIACPLLFITGIPFLPFHISWLLKLPFFLFAAAGVIAIVSAVNTPPGKGPYSDGPDRAAKD